MIETPGQVIQELAAIRAESERGIILLREASEDFVRLDLLAEKAEWTAFLDAKGTVADKQAIAKLHAAEAKEAAEIAKVKVDYIKTKLRHLSEATMGIQTSARMIELDWRTTK